ncbi:hypothetical protein [Flagellimonas sp.]|uniref:hypothetical protein n=1 Tax=Flagellimonas sp. TaxID=2058762 RepID=UPI003B5BA15F
MTSKNKIQIEVETILSTSLLTSVGDLGNTNIINYEFSQSDKEKLINVKNEDVRGLLFKGTVSLLIAIEKFRDKYYSWPTVNLYYSCFYLLKSSLCSRNVFLFRKERDMYHIDIDESSNLTKVPAKHKSDHNSSIYLFKKKYSETDILQSNDIGSQNSYEWLRGKREEINYKFPTFYEPACPNYWEEIKSNYPISKFTKLLKSYINDDDFIYPFLEDHAILALPIKRLELSIKDAKDNGLANPFNTEQKKILRERLNKLKINNVMKVLIE